MVNEFDMRGREVENISSGETSLLLQMEDDWQKLYHTEDSMPEFERWTYEQVMENPTPFLEAVGKIKAIPTYLYVFNYIFCKVRLALGRENQKRFIGYIKNGIFPTEPDENIEMKCGRLLECNRVEDEKCFELKDFDILYQGLVRRLEFKFRENGCRKSLDWSEFLRSLTEGFDYIKLKTLALGLHMTVTDFEIFLCKVLKRSNINFYNRDEIFLYLVLNYAEKFGIFKYFEAYDRLCSLYSDNEKATTLQNEKESISTLYIQSNLQEIVEKADSTLFVEKNEALNAYLKEIAVWNDHLESGEICRTAQKRFYEIWDELKKRWQQTEQMQEILATEREEQKQEGSVKKLSVTYKQDEEVLIPAGTKFKAKTCSGLAKVPAEVIFITEKETSLPATTSEKVCVKVKALLKPEDVKANDSMIGKLPEFVKENFIEKIVIDSPELKDAIHSIQIGKRVRFLQHEGKKNEGTFLLECMVGTYIPKGTKFHFKLDDMEFAYESVEPANVQEHVVEVKPLQVWENEDESDLRQKAKLKKYEELEAVDEKAESRMSGFVSAYVGKADHLGFFENGQANHFITIVSQKACEIPKGTLFRYTLGSRVFLYETIEKLSVVPAAEATIEVVWDNKEVFQKVVNSCVEDSKEVEFLPSKTTMDFELKNVCSVTAPKRTVLSPKTARDTDMEYNVSNGALLRLIYQTSRKNASEVTYYKGFPSLGPEHLLNTQLFKETRLIQSVISSMPANEERLRNYILTLKFLEFVWWYDKELCDAYDFGIEQEDYNMLVDDFEVEVDKEMLRCGFMPFFRTGFAYDAFLTLLLKSDDPLAIFQAVWSDSNMLTKEE